MSRGTVKWFNTTKGYGFIAPVTGEKDVFVHITQVQKSGLKRFVWNILMSRFWLLQAACSTILKKKMFWKLLRNCKVELGR